MAYDDQTFSREFYVANYLRLRSMKMIKYLHLWILCPKRKVIRLLSQNTCSNSTRFTQDAAAYTIQIVQKIARAIETALDAKGIVLMQLSGASAGQTVPHVHFHLIPSSVHELGRHAAKMGDQEKIKELAEKIKAAL